MYKSHAHKDKNRDRSRPKADLQIKPIAKPKYVLLHKPYGVLCQFTDEAGRATLKDYVAIPGIYACGRLDYDSEGLLLLTDDGALIKGLADPKSKMPKTYFVQVEGVPSPEAMQALRVGVVIEGRKTLPAQARLAPEADKWPPRNPPIRERKHIPTTWIQLVLTEGRNRQVRRMTAAVGHPTLRLIRIAIGPFELGDLQLGQSRELSSTEVRQAVAMR